MARARRLAGIAFLAVGAIVLAYGYWFSSTHGTLFVAADGIPMPGRTSPVVPAELIFFDASNAELARAARVPPWNAIVVTSPAEYACHALEQMALTPENQQRWQTCFRKQSRWLTTWIRRADHVTVTAADCRLERVPLAVQSYSDWWMWWVPLPHSGGRPYTSFSVRLAPVDPACSPGDPARAVRSTP